METGKVHILSTNTTPEVLLNPDGYIKIKGRAIDESKTIIPKQVMSWIDAYVNNPSELTEVIIALEFLNSFNTIILTSTLKKFSQVKVLGKKLHIQWFYEEDDLDIFERGEYISSTINIPIEFKIAKNIYDC